MSATVTITINTLRTFPMGNPNRGDDNQVKRAVFGRVERTYRSPQNRKALQRRHRGPYGLDGLLRRIAAEHGLENVEKSIRTREIGKIVGDALENLEDLDPARVKPIATMIAKKITGTTKDKENGPIVVLGAAEAHAIGEVARQIHSSWKEEKDKEAQDNELARLAKLAEKLLKEKWKELASARKIAFCGIDGALFGTMATAPLRPAARSAVAYGFEFSVHPATRFQDAFVALDDFATASAHMDVHSRASGTHYGDIMIDIRQLIENVTADTRIQRGEKDWREAPEDDFAIAALIASYLVRVNEEANITAVHSNSAGAVRADLIYIEICTAAPHNYANAFLDPVREQDVVRQASARLSKFASSYRSKYGHVKSSAWIAPNPDAEEGFSLTDATQLETLDQLCEWVRQNVMALRQV